MNVHTILSLASSLIEFTNKHLLCESEKMDKKKLEHTVDGSDMDFMYEATTYPAAYIWNVMFIN